LLGVLACTPPPREEPPLTSSAPATTAPAASEPAPWRPGDVIGSWRVVRADVRRDPVENGWTGEVDLDGEVSVNGTFQPHFDSELGLLCFFVDESDRAKLPRFPNDVRRPWFCFTNEDEVRRVATAGKRARIRIAKYHYRYSHTDVFNTVEFVAVDGESR
jgi:hypothetical protein